MVKKGNKSGGGGRRKNRNQRYIKQEGKMYFDGRISQALPGAHFEARVDRGPDLEPIIIDCNLRTILKVKRFKLIKGDPVTIEVDPVQGIADDGSMKGVIVEVNPIFNNPRPVVKK